MNELVGPLLSNKYYYYIIIMIAGNMHNDEYRSPVKLRTNQLSYYSDFGFADVKSLRLSIASLLRFMPKKILGLKTDQIPRTTINRNLQVLNLRQ